MKKRNLTAAAAAIVTALTAMTAPMTAKAADELSPAEKYEAEVQIIKKQFGPFYTLGEDASLYQKGDITMDGTVDLLDFRAALVFYNNCVNLNEKNYLTDAQMELANVVNYQHINSSKYPIDFYDLVTVLKYYHFNVNLGENVTMEELAAPLESRMK